MKINSTHDIEEVTESNTRKIKLFHKRRKADKKLYIDIGLKEYVNLKLEIEIFWNKLMKEC